LFVWANELFIALLEVVSHVIISTVDDVWVWKPGFEEGFSVKSTYVFLDNTLHPIVPISSLQSFAFNYIWKSGVPSKVSAFSWQLVLDRIPTRDNLRRRGILNAEDSRCPFCHIETETSCHLFLHCNMVASVWNGINSWLGMCNVITPTVPMSYAVLVGCGSNKNRRKGLSVIWLAYMWAVWKARNNCVFNNVELDVPTVVDMIQRMSWNWFVINTAKGSFLLYEWVWNPIDCMLY
jgi:hypothetical protein